MEQNGMIVMEAAHFARKQDVEGKGFQVISYLGRMGDAVKAFPVTESWIGCEEAPFLQYDFTAEKEGSYTVQLYLSPRNPSVKRGHIRCRIAVNEEPAQLLETVSTSLYTEYSCLEWNRGVMDNIRIVKASVEVKLGLNHLYFYAGDPGIVLERIVLHRADRAIAESYLGPQESWRV